MKIMHNKLHIGQQKLTCSILILCCEFSTAAAIVQSTSRSPSFGKQEKEKLTTTSLIFSKLQPHFLNLCFEIKELELLNVQKNIKKNSPLKRSSKFDLEGRRIFAFSWFVLLSENGCGNENKQTTSNTRFGVRSEVERQPLLLMKQF